MEFVSCQCQSKGGLVKSMAGLRVTWERERVGPAGIEEDNQPCLVSLNVVVGGFCCWIQEGLVIARGNEPRNIFGGEMDC